MPIDQVLKLVGGLELDSQSINTWKMGVERALKKISAQRHQSCRTEVPQLRQREPGVSGRLPDMHLLRSLAVWLIQ